MIDIRSLRLEQGMSQKELSEKSGIKRPNLSAYENGRKSPNTKTLNRILEVLGVKLGVVENKENGELK